MDSLSFLSISYRRECNLPSLIFATSYNSKIIVVLTWFGVSIVRIDNDPIFFNCIRSYVSFEILKSAGALCICRYIYHTFMEENGWHPVTSINRNTGWFPVDYPFTVCYRNHAVILECDRSLSLAAGYVIALLISCDCVLNKGSCKSNNLISIFQILVASKIALAIHEILNGCQVLLESIHSSQQVSILSV